LTRYGLSFAFKFLKSSNTTSLCLFMDDLWTSFLWDYIPYLSPCPHPTPPAILSTSHQHSFLCAVMYLTISCPLISVLYWTQSTTTSS
jgi:hypothetical protein